MVTDALLDFAAWIVTTVVGWFPSPAPPSWLGDASPLLTVFQGAASMGAWLPVSLGFGVAAAVLACVLVGLLIKVARSVASYFLAGGGSSG